tara:strand:+ start:315 stop:746 length:432 start_codon:yes stop_codon:yes gene_type:complete
MKRLGLVNRFSVCYLSKLAEGVTINEIMGDFVVTNKPLIVLLKDTISEGTTELVDDSVETRFGGVSLPTSIKYSDEIITNLCNQVVVQVYFGQCTFGDNFSISVFPVGVCLDGIIHLGFNLTQNGVRLFDFYSMASNEGRCNP